MQNLIQRKSLGLPKSELPRERLVRDGIDALSLQELVAILLGTGTNGKSVLVLAQEMLEHFGGLDGLIEASVEELMQFKGIGEAKAITLKAAFGIAKRASKQKYVYKMPMNKLSDALELAKLEIGNLSKEALLIILRDVKGRRIHHEVVSIGTLSEVLVHPREVFEPAVRYKAHSIVVCHNHPSGDPTPSRQDIELTKRLFSCAEVMGIILADHLIIGADEHVSMKTLLHKAV